MSQAAIDHAAYETTLGSRNPFFIASATQQASEPLKIDSSNWESYLQDRIAQGDDAAIDKLINYYQTEQSAKTARDWTSEREDNAYQRLMADIRKAGISPYILTGAAPSASGATGKAYSGSQMTSRANNKDTVAANERSRVITSLLAGIGIIFGSAIRAASFMK